MDKKKPKFSIITVCYNAAPLIQKTLESACLQTFQDFELVIVDGASTDDTLSKLAPFNLKIGGLISEKDAGIYDAMNKGVDMANGEWLYFLNAGDSFFDPTVLANIKEVAEQTKADFIYAQVQTINEPTGVNYIAGASVNLKDFWFKYPICHQGTFAKKSVFTEIGKFNTQYKLISDTEWFIRLFKHRDFKTHYLNRVIAFYDVTGATYQKRMLGMREYIHASFIYFPLPIAMLNLLSYPIIWCKVKLIRELQHTSFFKLYRQWKFKHKTTTNS